MKPRLKKLLEDLKKLNLKEDTRPSEGIWWYVWLKPRWRIEAFKVTEYGELNHSDVWPKYVAPMIAAHYKVPIGSEVYNSLAEVYASMPRGRVEERDGRWVFNYGDDFPVDPKKAQMQLPGEFELYRHLLAGKVVFRVSEHEGMIEDDKDIIQRIIGKIPYKKGKP